MFQIRYKATQGGAYTTLTLNPAPSAVEYPERRAQKVHATQDGGIVVQRPLRDSRPRKWHWTNYPANYAAYASQWATLKALEYRTRLEAGQWPLVEVWEDTTDGGFDRMDGATQVWTVVKLLRVDRTVRGSGPVVYSDSVLEFVIQDETFSV